MTTENTQHLICYIISIISLQPFGLPFQRRVRCLHFWISRQISKFKQRPCLKTQRRMIINTKPYHKNIALLLYKTNVNIMTIIFFWSSYLQQLLCFKYCICSFFYDYLITEVLQVFKWNWKLSFFVSLNCIWDIYLKFISALYRYFNNNVA